MSFAPGKVALDAAARETLARLGEMLTLFPLCDVLLRAGTHPREAAGLGARRAAAVKRLLMKGHRVAARRILAVVVPAAGRPAVSAELVEGAAAERLG